MKPSKKSKRDGCQFCFIALILFSQTYPDMPSVRSSNVLVGHPLFTMGSKYFWIQTQNLLNLVQTCLNLSEIGLNLSSHAKCSFQQPWFWLVTPSKLGSKSVWSCIQNLSHLVPLCLNLSKLMPNFFFKLHFGWKPLTSVKNLVS